MLLAMSREIATKDDIESLRRATREDVERLEAELKSYIDARINEFKSYMDAKINELKSYVDARINDVNTRMSDLYGVMKASLIAIVVTLASTILVPYKIIRIFF
jgi:predicted RecB family nuclease